MAKLNQEHNQDAPQNERVHRVLVTPERAHALAERFNTVENLEKWGTVILPDQCVLEKVKMLGGSRSFYTINARHPSDLQLARGWRDNPL